MAFPQYDNAEQIDPTSIAGTEPDVLLCEPRSAYVLTHSPNGWDWSQIEKMFLPKIAKLILELGSNGYKRGRQGATAALAAARARGLQVLEPATTPFLATNAKGKLEEHVGYVRRHKCTGGYVYLSPWEHIVTDHRGRASFKGNNDEEGERASKRMWVERGLIPDITPVKAAELTERMRHNAERMRALDNGKNGYALKAKALDADREAAEASMRPQAKAGANAN